MRAVAAGAALLGLIVLGEAGHVLLDELGAAAAHHIFHLVFPLVAFGLFGGLVARDVRQHGWPRFSWQLGRAHRDRGVV
jgi:hypothetical protein